MRFLELTRLLGCWVLKVSVYSPPEVDIGLIGVILG